MGKIKALAMLFSVSLLLGGCSLFENYSTQTPEIDTSTVINATSTVDTADAAYLAKAKMPPVKTVKKTVIKPTKPVVTTVKVLVKDFAFSPSSLTVKVGTVVKWTNADTAPHLIASDSADFKASPQLANGDAYSYTFSKKGTINYYCSIHPSMIGTIKVE